MADLGGQGNSCPPSPHPRHTIIRFTKQVIVLHVPFEKCTGVVTTEQFGDAYYHQDIELTAEEVVEQFAHRHPCSLSPLMDLTLNPLH